MVSIKRFIDGPLTETGSNLNKVLVPAGEFVYDVQQKEHSWLYPAKQRKIVKFYKFLRGVSPFAQPAYYGLKFWKEEQ